ncbi:hypothetical protein [Pseudomonas sp. F3-2]|uniref:hypothetical protein n=1 Tax=Pseudomonas sp. F3-2 TaxID=3141539 RepID=UPI00315DC53E
MAIATHDSNPLFFWQTAQRQGVQNKRQSFGISSASFPAGARLAEFLLFSVDGNQGAIFVTALNEAARREHGSVTARPEPRHGIVSGAWHRLVMAAIAMVSRQFVVTEYAR